MAMVFPSIALPVEGAGSESEEDAGSELAGGAGSELAGGLEEAGGLLLAAPPPQATRARLIAKASIRASNFFIAVSSSFIIISHNLWYSLRHRGR